MALVRLFRECSKFVLNKNNLNKYTITMVLFVAWIGLFDSYNLIEQFKLSRAVTNLKSDKIDLEKRLKSVILAKRELDNNPEKYAREKFFMHKENEEIIIIERKENERTSREKL